MKLTQDLKEQSPRLTKNYLLLCNTTNISENKAHLGFIEKNEIKNKFRFFYDCIYLYSKILYCVLDYKNYL